MPPFLYFPALLPLYAAVILSPGVISLVAALAGPIVAYLVAARRFSGKIQTTEATDLWKESRDIRKWSRERIEALEKQNNELDKRVRDLEKENSDLRARLGATLNP